MTRFFLLMMVGLYLVDTIEFYSLFIGASGYVQSIIPLTPLKTYLCFQDFSVDRDLFYLLMEQKGAASFADLSQKTQQLLTIILDQKRENGIIRIPFKELSIVKGQVYRLVTPVFLHANLLHIAFNLLWFFPLAMMIEKRAREWKLFLIVIMVAIVSNIAQFFVTGPLFVGISGVVCGLAGFIFARSKKAPWEGYSVTRSGIGLLFFYILFLSLIEILGRVMHYYGAAVAVIPIANTAHVVGAMVGVFLGWNRWFRCSS